MDGEVLNCYREVGNTHDPSAVAVRKDAVTVGHFIDFEILFMNILPVFLKWK